MQLEILFIFINNCYYKFQIFILYCNECDSRVDMYEDTKHKLKVGALTLQLLIVGSLSYLYKV